MKQEGKELLFKDLCARLPYGVILETDNVFPQKLEGISFDKDEFIIWVSDGGFKLDWMGCKPYLFPLSNMTDEQMEELKELCDMFTPDNHFPYAYWGIEVLRKHVLDDSYRFNFKTDIIDWLNKNHFDYRGLITMGLAIDATGLNIY